MIGLSAAQLTLMRAQVDLMLPETVVISRVTNVSDGAGGYTATYNPISGGTVIGRIDPVTSRNAISDTLGRESLTVMYQLTLHYDAPLQSNDRVTVDSNVYDVKQLSVGHSNNVSVRAQVSRVE